MACCSSCGHDDFSGARYCSQCGVVRAPSCGGCGATAAVGARFCSACGAALDAGEAAATAAEPRRRPDAPEENGERRHLTVVFCDIVDSTALAARLDPEDWRETVVAYHDTASAIVARYDGLVATFLGDGILIYFGYPRAHEDDPARALRAALELIDATGPLNQVLTPRHGVTLRIRVGVHTGPVVMGPLGSGDLRETVAIGDTMNVAARLQGVAEPDTVVTSEATRRLVVGQFVTRDRGAHTLKGIAEPGSS